MKYSILFFLISFNFSFALSNRTIPKNLEIKLDKVLKEHFNGSFSNKEKIQFSTEVQQDILFNHEEDIIYKVKDLNSNTVGFAYVGKQKSKIALFDYVVIFDKNLIITQIKILIYREDHGGEIASVRWLKQFIGFDKNQTMIYKKDIAGISGATISANSLTLAVNNVLKTFHKLHQLKLLQ